jgi:predicted MFS family arabinose efflux permease
MTALKALWRDPALRTVTLTLFLLGAFAGSLAPYVSLLGVEVFGLGDRGYAAVLVTASVLSVVLSIYLGIRADQKANRRGIAILCAAANLAGIAGVAFWPSAFTFVLAHALLLPLGSALFGQCFAMARLAASGRPADERDAILSTIRAIFALPFILVLPALSLAVAAGLPLARIYLVVVMLAALVALVIQRQWPRDGAADWVDRPSGLTLRAALSEIAHPAVSARAALTGIIACGSTLNMALVGLIFTTVGGRPESDVALFVGLFAGLEVPFMLMTPMLLRRSGKATLIAAGGVIFGLHLILLAPLSDTPFVWLLVLPAACGGAIYLSVPIAYLQDLLADRPGTGSSLMALQRIASEGTAALAFMAGTAVSGYGLAATLGALAAALGGLALLVLDRSAQRQSKNPFGA